VRGQVFHVPPVSFNHAALADGSSASEVEGGIAAVMNKEDLTPFLRITEAAERFDPARIP